MVHALETFVDQNTWVTQGRTRACTSINAHAEREQPEFTAPGKMDGLEQGAGTTHASEQELEDQLASATAASRLPPIRRWKTAASVALREVEQRQVHDLPHIELQLANTEVSWRKNYQFLPERTCSTFFGLAKANAMR